MHLKATSSTAVLNFTLLYFATDSTSIVRSSNWCDRALTFPVAGSLRRFAQCAKLQVLDIFNVPRLLNTIFRRQ